MTKPILLTLAVWLTLSSLPASAARSATWRSLGPEGGSFESLVIAPSDRHVVYAANFNGGVFRSQNGGASWTAVNRSLDDLAVFSLAVDPRDSAVVYAGALTGLYKTTSGGGSWRLLPLQGDSGISPTVSVIQIDPDHPQIIYAGTDAGVFRTADGGAHWSKRNAGLPALVSALVLDRNHPGTLYASIEDLNFPGIISRVYKTTNSGGSWVPLPGLQTSHVSAFALQRSTGTLYASTSEGLFATRDGGATWTRSYQGDDLGPIVLTPSGTLFGGFRTRGVLRSTDGGQTWTDPAPSSHDHPYGEIASLALDRPGNHLLAGAELTGIFSLDADTGWTRANRGLRATDITGLAVSSSRLFVSVWGEGVFVSDNGGASFSVRNSGILPDPHAREVDAFGLAVDPRSPDSLAVGLYTGAVAQTSDAGLHWASETPTCLPVDRLALTPPATIFAAPLSAFFSNSCPDSCTAKVSRDGGASFVCLDGPRDVSAFLVDPLRPAIVYAAASDALWKSTDRGQHFTLVASNIGAMILSLATSPAAHQVLYAVSDHGLLKSPDGGVSWSPIGTDLVNPDEGLVVDPSDPSVVYATGLIFGPDTSFYAIFVSNDAGASWSRLGDGFPAADSVPLLALDSVHHVLYAGTRGGGVWALSLP